MESVAQRKYRQWTPELSNQFREVWENLKSDAEVAKVFDITEGAARRRRQFLGILVTNRRQVKARKWTEEMDQALRDMRGKYTSTVIAEKLNVTRCAVVGRAFRLGLERIEPGSIKGAPRRPSAKKKPTLRARLRLVVDNTAQVEDSEIPVEQRCSLFDLNESTCRWPVGDPDKADFFFCGAQPVSGCSYCASHAMRAYQCA
jgi:GcrA cell cycle regulator